MKKYETHLQIICLALGVLFLTAAGNAQTTSFSFQGDLPKDITPATATYQMQFRLLDAETGGTQIGTTIAIADVDVKNRAFGVVLDFGVAAFPGADRFVEVGVRRTGSSEPFLTIDPRTRILSVPYAIRSLTSATADNALNLGGVDAADFVQTSDARLSDSRDPNPGSNNYIQNTTVQQAPANFNISGSGSAGGTISGNLIDTQTHFSIGGVRFLSKTGTNNTFAGINSGVANTTGQGNAFYGTNAGVLNSTGSFNAIFGSFAGVSNTVGIRNAFFGTNSGRANVDGNDNTFIGTNTGFNNLAGSRNTLVGSLAGVGNTEGDDNSFFGANTGFNNSTGSQNSFFGANAGLSNTTGGGNSFFGRRAGSSNTTANSNSFFGSSAGRDNTTGSDNVFVGSAAGATSTTGSFNTFVGSSAGLRNTIGSSNAFFGSIAGSDNTTGIGNAFFGSAAGKDNVTGNDNAFFGHNTGFITENGNGNSYFGSNAAGADGLNNAAAIGFRSFVSQSNSLVLGGITGFNGGVDTNVGIGTTAPADRLHVDGIIRVSTLGAAGSTSLCRNALNQISDCSSSLNYKTDIAAFRAGLNLVNRLQPITFKWRDGGMSDLGLGAEDVAAIESLLVNLNAKGQVEGVKYDRIGVVLINAVKEQQAQIEAQTELIKRQQEQIDALTKLVCTTNAAAEFCKENR